MAKKIYEEMSEEEFKHYKREVKKHDEKVLRARDEYDKVSLESLDFQNMYRKRFGCKQLWYGPKKNEEVKE